jgi:membrane fusion protein, heavy metal efflux system
MPSSLFQELLKMQAPNDVDSETPTVYTQPAQARGWMVALLVIGLAAACSALLWLNLSKPAAKVEEEETAKANTVELNKLSATEIATVIAGSKPPVGSFSVAATVEANQQQLQQITPLVSGRVRNIYVSLGDNVSRGMLLLRIDSPQVAELHGKLHEAETRVRLAKLALKRVNEAASRVNILKSKASLDEAEATLRRTKQLVSEGLTAKKDLVAAQSEYDRAKADYNFQKDISLNREVAEAQAEYSTASTEADHLVDGLRALDAHLPVEGESNNHDISTIELRSPIAGTVIERFVNQGSGFDQGKPLLTIANTSNLWVIANVPEKQMAHVRVGSAARVAIDTKTVTGSVNYIDPRLNEDTRTARVRVEIANPGNKLKAGNFAQVEFQEPPEQARVYVPTSAVQTVDGGRVVFVKVSDGQFAVRKIVAGSTVSDMVPVLSGLKAGEVIAANGSFILKSKLLKEQFGDDD